MSVAGRFLSTSVCADLMTTEISWWHCFLCSDPRGLVFMQSLNEASRMSLTTDMDSVSELDSFSA